MIELDISLLTEGNKRTSARLTRCLIGIFLIPIAVLAAGGGCSDEVTTRPVEARSMHVIGDSLCYEGWPGILETDLEVSYDCVRGARVDQMDVSVQADIIILSLGTNDAWARKKRGAKDPALFERDYRELYAKAVGAKQLWCVLPPLSDHPKMQAPMLKYHAIISHICGPDRIYAAAPSDADDGVHYTSKSMHMMAKLTESALGL